MSNIDQFKSKLLDREGTDMILDYIRTHKSLNEKVLRYVGENKHDFQGVARRFMIELGDREMTIDTFVSKAKKYRFAGKLWKPIGRFFGTSLGKQFPLVWIYLADEYCMHKGSKVMDRFVADYIGGLHSQLGSSYDDIEEEIIVEEEIVDEVVVEYDDEQAN